MTRNRFKTIEFQHLVVIATAVVKVLHKLHFIPPCILLLKSLNLVIAHHQQSAAPCPQGGATRVQCGR